MSVNASDSVKQILDRAAGESTVDYDGRGRFWHLPLAQLLEVKIHGVRMIAPPETVAPSCCHAVVPAALSGGVSRFEDRRAAADHYREEQRWPASEFWRRRHAETRSVMRDS